MDPLFTSSYNEADARRRRQQAGLWLGALAGLVYGLTASLINPVLLWGVPLQINAGTVALNGAFSAMGLALIGYVVGWSESSIKGLIAGALLLAGFGVARAFAALAAAALDAVGVIIALITTFLPSAALSLVIATPLRWGINQLEDAQQIGGRVRRFRIVRTWGLALIVAVLAGSTSQWAPEIRSSVQRVDTLLQTTLTTGVTPPALASIPGLSQRLSTHYTLDPRLDVSADTSIAGSVNVATVIVRVVFDSGLQLDCLLNQNMAQPLCAEPP